MKLRAGSLIALLLLAGCLNAPTTDPSGFVAPSTNGIVSSHAPSPRTTTPPSPVPAFSAVPASPTPASSGDMQTAPSNRATADRPDDMSGWQIHVLYVLPADAPDTYLDTDGSLHDAVTRMNQWLALQAKNGTLRFDTAQGRLDATFFRLSATEAQIQAAGRPIDTIRTELNNAGFNVPGKAYACFYGGAPAADGALGHGGGGYAAVYMKNDAGYRFMPKFGPSSFEARMLHEIMHAIGFVPACAPHADADGHVANDGRDLMAPSWNRGIDNILLDPDHDDYFGHGRAECPDLANSGFLDPLPAAPQAPVPLNPTASVAP